MVESLILIESIVILIAGIVFYIFVEIDQRRFEDEFNEKIKSNEL
jgi:hypothetical protein